jgi:hypothetical protein
MLLDAASPVRLHGRPGLLRLVTPGHSGDATEAPVLGAAPPIAEMVDGGRWIWEGAVDGPGLVAMLRSAMVHGIVPCEVDGRPHRARAIGCWYDAGGGTALVELAGRPEPLA